MSVAHPLLSVVMSTYNDADHLSVSIDSVLNQDYDDFEFIIINDGSPDLRTADILTEYAARDARVRVINKQNEGLTKALIDGCRMARGEYIARQDADDISLPRRFSAQVELMEKHPEASFCVSGTRVIAPEGEILDEIIPNGSSEFLTQQLLDHMTGVPSHGCVMFRKEAYEKAGGYHWQFYYAQDADLWLRLGEAGPVVGVSECLYELRQNVTSISAAHSPMQSKFCQLAQSCYKARTGNQSEEGFLSQAEHVREQAINQRLTGIKELSPTNAYRMYSARLKERGDSRGARKYLKYALKISPFSIKLWKDWVGLQVV